MAATNENMKFAVTSGLIFGTGYYLYAVRHMGVWTVAGITLAMNFVVNPIYDAIFP